MSPSSIVILASAPLVHAWGEAVKPAGNPLDMIVNPVMDVAGAVQGAAGDVFGYLIGAPQTGADFVCWSIALVRSLPSLFTNVWNGDGATQDGLASFCVSCATMCFIVYATVAALNFLLATTCSVKNYFNSYLKIASWNLLGLKLPKPAVDALAPVQKHLLDPIINWKVSYIMPLSGEKGSPTVGSMASTTAAAISLSMLLGSVPTVLALMRGGANKADAEALAWTVGTALGVQYLVAKNN